MPIATTLALLVALGLGSPAAPRTEPDDPAALVARLGDADPAAHDAAASALRALGRAALPALEAAIRRGDAAVGPLASTLWEDIQRDLMPRASTVRLDGQGRSMKDVLADLGEQAGVTLQINQSRPQDEAIALREPNPVPLWEAIHRLGFESIYHQNPGEGRFPSLTLQERPAQRFVSTDGPFRIALTRLHLYRDRQLIQAPWVQVDGLGQRIGIQGQGTPGEVVTAFGDLVVMVEPRVWFTQEAQPRLVEATDDRGRSLVPDEADLAREIGGQAHFAFSGGSGVTEVSTQFRLRPIDERRRVARLRGVVPLMLHQRRPVPTLDIPLADAAGKTFRCDEATIEVLSVTQNPENTSVATIVRLNVDRANLLPNPENEVTTSRLQVLGAHQLELADDSGRALAHGAGSGSGGGSTPAVYRWTISSFRSGQATRLRYYDVICVRTDANFEFRDVPLP